MLGDGITHGRSVASAYISRCQPSIRATSSVAPRPNASLNKPASSPIVIPWRIGMGKRPTNDSKPRDERLALDVDAVDRDSAGRRR